MSKTFKIVAGVIVLLLIAAGAVGYFVCLPAYEKKQAQRIADFIESLPGTLKADSVEVSLIGKKCVITGLKGQTAYLLANLDLDIARIEGHNINLDAPNQTGVNRLLDSLRLTDVKLVVVAQDPNFASVRQEVSYKEAFLKDVQCDLARILNNPLPLYDAQQQEPADPALLQAGLDAWGTVYVKYAAISGYKQITTADDNPPLTVTIEEQEYNDCRLLTYGPGTIKTVGVSFEGGELSFASGSFEGMEIPNLLTLLATPDAFEEFLDLFQEQPMILKNMRITDLRCKVDDAQLTLASSKLNMELGTGKILLQHETEGLVLPPEIYALLDQKGPVFARVYGKNLELSGKMDIEISQKDGNGEVLVRELSLNEPNLISVLFNAELPYQGRGEGLVGLIESGSTNFLKKSFLEIEDRGFVEYVLTVEHAVLMEDGLLPPDSTPATLRQSLIQSLAPLAQLPEAPDLQKIINGVMQLAGAPGKLSISINPEEPLNLDMLIMTGGMGPLNATVEYAPAQ